MHRITRAVASSLLVACALWPVAATAQTQSLNDPLMTVDQVRDAFGGAGYRIDESHAWDWTWPPVTTFEVHGQNDGRVLMVLVYPSQTAAQDARQMAESHEQALNAGQPFARGGGPHLVSGYGLSDWNGNVALVQSSEVQLERLYDAQVDRDMRAVGDVGVVGDPSTPDISVDVDFLQALRGSAVNL
jgi:hypothetical protein